MCTSNDIEVNNENKLDIPVQSHNVRPMFCELNALTRSDGSALLTQGETAIMASVYGPIEGKLQNAQIEKSYVEVYYRCKSGMPSVNDRLREQIIRNTCQYALLTMLYPRTAITIQLQEMEDRAGLIACSINAACLAILNSGLSMKCLVAAVHCCINFAGDIILDPDHRQSKADDNRAYLTFVFDSVERNTVAMHTEGKFTVAQYNDAMAMAREASSTIFQFYKDAVRKFSKIL